MDLTNRVVIIGGALLCIFLVFVVILLAWGAPDQSIDRLGDLASYLEDHNDTPAKLIVTFGGLIFVLLAFMIIIYEVAPPTQTGNLKLGTAGGADARISTEEIARRLEGEVRLMPQVSDVQATVLGRGQKAEVKLDLHVSAEADLAITAEEACRRASQLLEHQMGLELARPPQAQLHYRELRVSTSPAAYGPPPAQPAGPAANPLTEPTHEASQTAQEDRPAGA